VSAAMQIDHIPTLELDVAVVGSETQDSTVGGVCVIVGVVAGVMINQQTHAIA